MAKKEKLSADAEVIVRLMNEQSLSFNNLVKSTGISWQHLYDALNKLMKRGITRFVKKDRYLSRSTYALFDFTSVDEAILQLSKRYSKVSLDDVADIVGKPPHKIVDEAYRAAKKLGVTIAPKSYRRHKQDVWDD